jgi:hypothetical protein
VIIEQLRDSGHATPSPRPLLGRVLSVHGSQASVGLRASGLSEPDDVRATVGKFLGISTTDSTLVGVITDVSIQTLPIAREQGFHVTADLDLLGEIKKVNGVERFHRGVTRYAAIGDVATEIGPRELRLVYNIAGSNTVEIG